MTKYREIWDEHNYKFNSLDSYFLLKDVDWGNTQRKEVMDIIIYGIYAAVAIAVVYSFITSI